MAMRYTSYRARFKLPPANGADLSRNQAITAAKAQMEERAGSTAINDYIVEALLFFEQAKASAARGEMRHQTVPVDVAVHDVRQANEQLGQERPSIGPELAQQRPNSETKMVDSVKVEEMPVIKPVVETQPEASADDGLDIQAAVVEAISGDMPAIVPMDQFMEEAKANEEKDTFVPMEMDRVNPELRAQPKSSFLGTGFMV